MIRKLELKDVGPAPAIDMQFGPRLNLLTGDNGLGKSFVLDVIWWAATGSWPGFPVMPKREAQSSTPGMTCHFDEGRVEATCRPGSLDWETTYVRGGLRGVPAPLLDALGPEPPWLPAVFLCAHVDGSCSVWDGNRGSVAPLRFSVDELRNGLSLRDATRPDGRDDRFVCNGLIRDWVVWQLRRSEPFDLLCRVLAVLSPDPPETLRPGEPQRISVEDAREYPTIEMPYGTVPIIHASAAVQRVLHLAYLLVWAWAENRNAARMLGHSPSRRFAFLIDEVEAHLHPRWQRLILRALLEVVRQLDPEAQVQVIATTHSPLVLASAEPLFDPEQDALFTFDLEGSSVVVRRAEWRTRGDASAWLTSDVFDLGEARSVEAERAITHAREGHARQQPGARAHAPDPPRAARRAEGHRPVLAALAGDGRTPRDRALIHVEPQPEPPDFDARVRQPGLRALAEGRMPEYWRACLDDLCRAYGRICAYLCVLIPPGTGARSVDHLAAKSRQPELAYEWTNYRLVCSLMNARKRAFADVLDPFEIPDGWFVLEFSFLQVLPNPQLEAGTKAQVEATIRRLKLNDNECRDARALWYDAYLDGDITFTRLEQWSPFIAKELRRQGRVA